MTQADHPTTPDEAGPSDEGGGDEVGVQIGMGDEPNSFEPEEDPDAAPVPDRADGPG